MLNWSCGKLILPELISWHLISWELISWKKALFTYSFPSHILIASLHLKHHISELSLRTELTCFMNSLDFHTPTKRVWTLPLTEVECGDVIKINCAQWLRNNDVLSLRTPVPRLCSECTTAVWRTKRVGSCFREAQMSSRGLRTRGLPMITATLDRRAWNNIHPLIMALFIWRMFTGKCVGVGVEGTSQCTSVSSTSAELSHFFPSFPHSLPLFFRVLFFTSSSPTFSLPSLPPGTFCLLRKEHK